MSRLGLGVRLAVLALALAALAPLQWGLARRGGRLAGALPLAFHRLLLRLLDVRVTTIGRPPAVGAPTLVVANHVSWLDIPVLSSLLPLSFVAKSEIAGWPIVGACARLQRCVFLDRARKAATAEANAVIAARLAEGDAVALFPEGTTGDGLRLLPFRSSIVGAARAALAGPRLERVTLQPLAIAYRRRHGLPLGRREMPAVAWYGDMDLAPHLATFLRAGPVDVVVAWGEPIPFDRDGDRKKATAAAEAAVREGLRAARGASVRPRAIPEGGAPA